MNLVFFRRILAAFLLLAGSLSVFSQGAKTSDPELVVSKCWSFVTEEPASRLLATDSGIFIGTDNARVDALMLDGSRLWSSELGGSIVSNMIVTDNRILVVTTASSSEAGRSDSLLRGLSSETGITSLSIPVPNSDRYFLAADNGMIILVSRNGKVIGLDRTGTIKWKREVAEGFVAEPFFSPGKVMIATTAKQIFTIGLANGEIESMRRSASEITAVAKTPAGEAIAGDGRGNLTVLNGAERPFWKFKSGGEISRIFVNGSQVIAASHDNFVYQLRMRNGDVEWKKRLGGRVQQMAILNGKHVLTASFDEKSAILTDILTGKVVGQIPFAENETISAPPSYALGSLTILTDRAVHQHSISGCPGTKESGRASIP